VCVYMGAASVEYANRKPPKRGSLVRKDDYQLAVFLMVSMERSVYIGFYTTTSGIEILAILERRFCSKGIQGQSQLFTKFTSIRCYGHTMQGGGWPLRRPSVKRLHGKWGSEHAKSRDRLV
jgi:hypothetical protein